MSSRQFYIMLIIGVISMKMQKLPSLVYGELGKDGYLLFGLYMIINIAFIVIAFYILKKLKIEKVFSPTKRLFWCGVRKIMMFAGSIYF